MTVCFTYSKKAGEHASLRHDGPVTESLEPVNPRERIISDEVAMARLPEVGPVAVGTYN